MTENAGGQISPKFFKHEYYKKVVYDWLAKKGITPAYEFPKHTSEGADVAAITDHDTFDAYEITLHFSNLADNITKCQRLKANKIFIVCENQAQITIAEQKAKKALGSIPDQTAFIKITEFF